MAQSVSNLAPKPTSLAGLFNPPKTGLTASPFSASTMAGSSPATTPKSVDNNTKSQLNFMGQPLVKYPAPVGGTVPLTTGFVPPTASSQSAPVAGLQKPPVTTTAIGGSTPLAQPQTQNSFNTAGGIGSKDVATPPARGLFPDVLSSLATSGTKNDALASSAQKIASEAGQKIADIGGEGARFQAGQRTTGTSPVAEGNAAVTAQTTAAAQQAVAQGANVALQGTQQGLTAQSQTQSALSSAGNLAQPQVTTVGQTSFDPTTGNFSNNVGGFSSEVMQQYAQMAASGQYTAIPSTITSNPVLNAQLNAAARALNPNYTPIGAQGASGVLAGIPALQSANTAAEGIKNTIKNYLSVNPTLNTSDLAAGNLLQQWIQGKQLTDPKYQILFNNLDEYTNTLAPILGVGGNPTNLKTQIAQGFVNAAASGKSIVQVLDAMSELATHKIQDLQNGALGNGTSVPDTTGGSTTGGFAEAW